MSLNDLSLDELTELSGKKVRRFTREAVFAALSRLAGKAA